MAIANFVNTLFEVYFWLIIVRIFLTWIPSIDWSSPPFRALTLISDLILEPFRRIVPSMGGLDFSPIIALLVLQVIQFAIVRMLVMLGV